MRVPTLLILLGAFPLALMPLVHVSAFGERRRDMRFAAGFAVAGAVAWLAGAACGLLWGILVSHPVPIIRSASDLELTAGCAALGGVIGVVAMCNVAWQHGRALRWLARIERGVADGSIEAIWPLVRHELISTRTAWHLAPELGSAALALVHGGHHSRALELFALVDKHPNREIDPLLAYAGAIAWASCGEPERGRVVLLRFANTAGDTLHAEARNAALAAVDVAEGRVDEARARIPAAPRPWIATTWRFVEASCHAIAGDRERAREVLATLKLADVRSIAASAFPAAPIARELLSRPPPYRS